MNRVRKVDYVLFHFSYVDNSPDIVGKKRKLLVKDQGISVFLLHFAQRMNRFVLLFFCKKQMQMFDQF